MATIIWRGWHKEPNEDCQEAYEILTGRNLKPFYKVFSRPQTLNNQPEQDIDDQAELGHDDD